MILPSEWLLVRYQPYNNYNNINNDNNNVTETADPGKVPVQVVLQETWCDLIVSKQLMEQ